MANSWFRMYAEFRTDPKVRTMSEAMQLRLAWLFCLRCDGPTENLSEEELMYGLSCDRETLHETFRLFHDKGFIEEDWAISRWNERQYVSDSSTERVRKFRTRIDSGEKRDETLHVTKGETDQNRTEQNRAEETKTKDTAPPSAPLAFALPVWISPETWKAFEETRRRIRKPMTNRARELIVAKLGRLRTQGQDAEAMLNQSIANSWQDVWPVKDEKGALGGGTGKTRTERNREALAGFIDELRQDAGGLGRSEAGHGKPGNAEVIQPSFSEVRTG